MQGNAINRLINNRDAIRKIMAMDRNGTMDKMVENAVSSGSLVQDGDGITYKNPNAGKSMPGKVMVNEAVMEKHSKMPKAILESFKQNPGQEPSMSGSVLSGVKMLDEVVEQESRQMLTEQKTPSTSTGMVDYSLLRTIINEAVETNVKKYVSAMTKKVLNESTGASGEIQAVKFGNKFSFITKDGKIYEATLKFVGNIDKK